MKLLMYNRITALCALVLCPLPLFTKTTWAAEVVIPKQADWTDRGTVITPGSSWDKRLGGMISPCTVIKKNGTYFLYYVGADGNRTTDGGPAHRKLGVATSLNGTSFSKYSGNPIISHSPQNNQEEGVFSAGAALDTDGTIVLYFGGMAASNSTSEFVDGDHVLATSSNGLNFTVQGDVVSHTDSRFPGTDELFPLGTFTANGNWYTYYTAKGGVTSWSLSLAVGNAKNSFQSGSVILSGGNAKGGADPALLSVDKVALFLVRDDGSNASRKIEVRTASTISPGSLSETVETYRFSDFKHGTVFLDTETNTWFMYYINLARDRINVKTAPVVVGSPPDTPTPTPPTGLRRTDTP